VGFVQRGCDGGSVTVGIAVRMNISAGVLLRFCDDSSASWGRRWLLVYVVGRHRRNLEEGDAGAVGREAVQDHGAVVGEGEAGAGAVRHGAEQRAATAGGIWDGKSLAVDPGGQRDCRRECGADARPGAVAADDEAEGSSRAQGRRRGEVDVCRCGNEKRCGPLDAVRWKDGEEECDEVRAVYFGLGGAARPGEPGALVLISQRDTVAGGASVKEDAG